jgi:hypothetical protein
VVIGRDTGRYSDFGRTSGDTLVHRAKVRMCQRRFAI